uniref:Tyrosine phosphatase family protein n=1 Tax=Ackermannviridae sp. ctQad106 TaxID=2826820 RepID=A0A8S5QN55_9CAUD|nr:MAG TPA: tyrosine phosphatase family protein [Ackermannviridae sp. ctQad106]
MADAVRALSGSEAVEWHQCPEAVRNYLANVTYDPSDYSTSQIANYAPATAVVNNYKPIGQTAGGVTHYNDVPNVLTPFASGGKAGTLKPLDTLRWVRTRESLAEAWNVRDLGGWACDGGAVKYGLLIRGGRISAADRAVLVGQCGIQHEIDLRGKDGRDPSDGDVATESPLGGDVWFTIADKAASYALTPVATWQLYLRCVIDAVTHREPVYFHCTAGADRTGTLACILEGLLGMSQSDIDKDYELTCFYSGTGTDALARRRNESDWKGLINAVNAVSGDSFREKCVHFAVGTCGMSMADINAYRAAMTNGTPETLHWYQTITKNLTGCTISNAASQVDYGEAYTATIAADSGKTITSVVVKMGGVDITATAYSAGNGAINIAKVTGAVTITASATVLSVTYTITRNLTNCASSNTANTIAEGAAYITTLSPTGTYKKLGTITVTMGGADISASAVSRNTITIASVTGDIVITCAAEITNIINTVGISADTRLSTSSGTNKAKAGWATIGANMDATSLIHLAAGDTLRIKGMSLPAATDGNSAAVEYSATATLISAGYIYNGHRWNNINFTSSGEIVTVTTTGEHNIRVSLICTDASAVIATINEPIT